MSGVAERNSARCTLGAEREGCGSADSLIRKRSDHNAPGLNLGYRKIVEPVRRRQRQRLWRLNARLVDHVRPLLAFGAKKRREFLGRAGERVLSDLSESVEHFP